jgi:hypothetical protein
MQNAINISSRLHFMDSGLSLGLAFLFALGCNNVTPNHSIDHPLCNTPISRQCSSDTCGFFEIYSYDSTLINSGNLEFHGTQYYAVWNGQDSNGVFVACGAYRLKETIIRNGISETKCATIIFTVPQDSGNGSTGRQACDSLLSKCTGTYHETSTSDPLNPSLTTVGCICCK